MISKELASFLFFVCLLADGIIVVGLARCYFAESDRRWQFTLREILIVVTIAAFQFWFLSIQFNGK